MKDSKKEVMKKKEREKRERYNKSIRDRTFDEFMKNSSLSNSAKPHKMAVSGAGSTSPMGVPKGMLTPNNKK